jgi:hypothetical protein
MRKKRVDNQPVEVSLVVFEDFMRILFLIIVTAVTTVGGTTAGQTNPPSTQVQTNPPSTQVQTNTQSTQVQTNTQSTQGSKISTKSTKKTTKKKKNNYGSCKFTSFFR